MTNARVSRKIRKVANKQVRELIIGLRKLNFRQRFKIAWRILRG